MEFWPFFFSSFGFSDKFDWVCNEVEKNVNSLLFQILSRVHKKCVDAFHPCFLDY